jgi:hypothetical protein
LPEKAKEQTVAICMDTDVGDLEKINHVPYIQTSKSAVIGEYLIADRDANDWFPKNRLLNNHDILRGSAQFRFISRLGLRAAIKEGKLEKLKTILSEVVRNNAHELEIQPVVFIVSTLAGGTGAGIFLQVAYIMRSLMRDLGINKYQQYGFFVLPDIIAEGSGGNLRTLSEMQKENMKTNGYACIKELTALYRYSSGHFPGDFKLSLEYHMNHIDSNLPLPKDMESYDYVFLFDRISKGGKILDSGIDPYYQQVEDILFLLGSTEVKHETLSKLNNELAQLIEANGRARYASGAVSRLIYPLDDIARYCTLKWISSQISLQWREIDNQFGKEKEEYLKARQRGEEPELPSRRDHFLQTLNQLSNQSQAGLFFQKVLQQTMLKAPKGISAKPKSTDFIEKLDEFIQAQVNGNRAFEARAKQELSIMDLKKEVSARNEISSFESLLEELQREVFKMLNSTKNVILSRVLPESGYKQNLKKEEIDLTRWFSGESSMHPLAIRYFLYDLHKKIADMLPDLEEANNGLKQRIDKYKTAYNIDRGPDDDEDETPEQRLDIAQNQNVFKRIVKNEFKSFTEFYAKTARDHQKRLKKYAEDKVKELVYKELKSALDILNQYFEQFFDQLISLETSLYQEIDTLNNKHHETSDSNNVYVLASKDYSKTIISGDTPDKDVRIHGYKEAIWHNVRADYNDQELPEEVMEGIFYMIYDVFIENFSTGESSATTKSALKNTVQQFGDVVIPLGVEKLKSNLKINLSLYDALCEEAKLNGKTKEKDMQNYISEKIRSLYQLAKEPLIRMNPNINHGDNTKLMFWGIHPDNAERINNGTEFYKACFPDGELVKSQAIDKQVIYFFSPSVSHEIEDFVPFNDSQSQFGRDKGGSYYQSYKNRLYKMHLYEKNRMQVNQDDLMAYLTPHLNEKWHKRSYLPEIRNGYGSYYDKLAREVFISGIIYGDILHVTSKQNESGWTWKCLENNSFNVLKDEYGYALSGNLSGLLDYMYDNPEHVRTLIKPVTKKLKEDGGTYSKAPEERDYFKRIKVIQFKGENYNILDIIALMYVENNDRYHSETCDLLLKDFAEDLSDLLKSIYTDTQLQVAADKYQNIIKNLIDHSVEFKKTDKASEWNIILEGFQPKRNNHV